MNTHKGFTLLELMIAIAVIGILAAIAIPNDQSYMIKTRRATARGAFLTSRAAKDSAWVERWCQMFTQTS
jgi:prepilin-type N-terminal cleavage/methylation domain-containing protein